MPMTRIVVFSVVALWTIGAWESRVGAGQAAATRSVWDGVYTEEQAKRGEGSYGQYCASCHGPTLLGGEMAPALTGGDFLANWSGLTLGDLSERIRISMPQNNPGSLSRQQVADVIAFMLLAGKFPAGQAELSRETEIMKQIRLEATKP